MKIKLIRETNFTNTQVGKIPVDWKIKRIDEIADVSTGGTPPRNIKKYWGGEIKWVKSQEVRSRFIWDVEETITKEGMENSNAKRIYPPFTVLVALYGATAGEISLLRTQATINQAVAALEGQKADNIFLFYSLLANKERLKALAIGSAQQNLYLKDVKEFEVPLPPIKEEQAIIGKLLFTFDELIENKKRQNKTLEAVAQAIFKNWFVDFEPFKDELVYNEELKKEIPKEWKVTNLIDVAKVTSGERPEQIFEKFSNEHPIPIYGGAGIMGYTTTSLFNEKVIVTGRVGTLGLFHRVTTPSWPSDNTLVIIPKEEHIFNYIFLLLKRLNIERFNRGTSNPLVTQKDLQFQKIILPSKYLILKFQSITEPLFKLIDENNKESFLLSQIRDILLPKLLSGEIRIKVDIEKEFPEETKKLEEVREEKIKLQESLEKWFK